MWELYSVWDFRRSSEVSSVFCVIEVALIAVTAAELALI